jgi:hypothetical protein
VMASALKIRTMRPYGCENARPGQRPAEDAATPRGLAGYVM